jgi:NitT/TauT family transport system substrate-binding protein
MRRPDDPDQRIGAMTLTKWKAKIDMTAESSKSPKLADERGDPNRLFTNELNDQINGFEKQAWCRLQRRSSRRRAHGL